MVVGCWELLAVEVPSSRFEISGCALWLLQGCHEKRGVRINMTNQRVLSFFLSSLLSLSFSSLCLSGSRKKREWSSNKEICIWGGGVWGR